MTAAGKKLNRYTCDACQGTIVTVDLDEGTTPFMLDCRAKDGCKGSMRSSFYRGVTGEPTHAWRKPTAFEYKRASAAMRRHFDLGGLDVWRIQ